MKFLFGSFALALLALSSACGVKTVKLKDTAEVAKVAPEKVEVFVDRKPARAYEEIAILQEQTGDFEDIVKGFKRRASQLGGDAIILRTMESKTQQKTTLILGKPVNYTESQNEMTAIVIQYTDAPKSEVKK